MQPKVETLVNYVRQRTWISINFLSDKTPEGVNFPYTEEQKKTWREDPKAFNAYRSDLEQGLENTAQPFFEDLCKKRMYQSLKDAPELEERILPDFHNGCRRIGPGDGYLEALQAPNCRACWDPTACVTETGIRLESGEEEAFDMIVCATGFDSSWLPQWEMAGRGGARLEDMWREEPRAFFATQVENFPNYGMVNGPNPPISHGSVLAQMGWTVDYLLRWITRMNRHDMRTLCAKKEAVDDFNAYAQEFLKRTVWSGECRTLYKNGRSRGTVTGVYAGSMMHFKNALEQVGGEHFDITWRSKNRFRCLGNGQAETDRDDTGDTAPYFPVA
ncbi:flavin-binding monooxygenase [Apiospora marii]|uniref:flavin-binding monooxygenase n=1 Tax=Apiospora marii TaxID=335849 RepID=UPI003130182B